MNSRWKMKSHFRPLGHVCRRQWSLGRWGLLAALILLQARCESMAVGTWTALTSAPPTGVNNCLLLSDGTVLGMNGGGGCVKLTPNSSGSYINGTWTTLATMNYSRLFFATQLLTNGNIFVAGGEYGSGNDSAEIYNPLANTWTQAPITPGGTDNFLDAISEILPNGNVLVSPVGPSTFGGTLIWNAASSTWSTGPALYRGDDQDEAAWVLLADTSILTIDPFGQDSERYIPSENQWVNDAVVPVPMYNPIGELGPGFLLPNSNAFYLGGTSNTAIYTPTGTSNPGSWAAGPNIPNGYGVSDGPAAMMVNGNILCCVGNASNYSAPAYFYEYNYVSNNFTAAPSPTSSTPGASYNDPPFVTSMLVLPDGNVLLVGGQNSTSFYVYTPSGPPLAAGKPVIDSISENADGSYILAGSGLNGISQGAAYGDDEQMNSNYPLVRMTNSFTGAVYYARTYNWNSTGVMTGAKVVTTDFSLPANLPSGSYSLVVVANGIASSPQTFSYAPPAVPTGLTAASGSNGFIKLSWNSSSGATAYILQRSSSGGGYFTTFTNLTGLAFTNTGLTNGLTYYYKVAAIGSGGPSSNSAAVSATPAGPPPIPGATNVSLAAYYNRAGIYSDGRTFSGGGFDGGGYAFSANLLGPSVFWNNLVFNFGPSNAEDVVYCASQVIPLPAGRFNTLQILAAAENGNQAAQTFTVTYTDTSTATFTQSFSDWANAQFYAGEFTVASMPYRDSSSGGEQALSMAVDGYVFSLNQTKSVQSITLPNDSQVVLMSMALANDPVSAPLTSLCDRAGIYTDGTTFTNPPTGGLDSDGYAYSGTLLGTSQTWSNSLFAFGPLNATNVISCTNQTIPLSPGNYSRLEMLATGVNGAQTAQSFVVTYSDSSTTTFVQSLSDWFTPGNYAGESKAIPMTRRDSSTGAEDNRTFYLYGYSFALNNSKIVQSVRVPNNTNVVVTAISLVPNWPPTFAVNPFTLPKVNAGVSYSGTIATNASDLNGDALTFAKVSGPAWLNVAANGTLSGVPANTNANTNTFVVSVTDTGGLSNTATLFIYVNGAPSFTVNPFTMPSIVAGLDYVGNIATNATDPNPGDVLIFAEVSGPAWLAVAPNGALSGTPISTNVGTNTFVVSVTDSGGLSNTATMNITVTPAPSIVSAISTQVGSVQLSWSGGIAPYLVQATSDLSSSNWQNVGGTISSNSLSITPTNSAMFYRILGQ
jgi:hypothetical protein